MEDDLLTFQAQKDCDVLHVPKSTQAVKASSPTHTAWLNDPAAAGRRRTGSVFILLPRSSCALGKLNGEAAALHFHLPVASEFTGRAYWPE